jgi:acetylornithine/succinyldiaminopimelate/putrescine aminotransferase
MMARDDVGTVRRHLLGAPVPPAPVVRRQSGAKLYATDGSLWLDAATGGFGAAHPAVNARIAEQAGRVALSSRVLVSRVLAEAVAALHEFCPDPLTISYLCNSGAEAFDSALKLAKGTHPERRLMLGLLDEDHGSLTHGQSLRRGTAVVPDQALSPVSLPPERAAELVDRVSDDIAAVVVAPAAPGRALSDLSPTWWARLRAACDAADVLLVVDERLTGPARVGSGLAVDRLGIVPDALVLGETLGGDAVPVGCMISSRAAFDRVYGRRNPTVQGSTFGANPLSAAAVCAVLSTVVADGLAQRQVAVAATAQRLLAGLAEPGLAVRSITADGSLVWLRTADRTAAVALAAELANERVLVRPPASDVVAILPPLTADSADVEDLFVRVAAAAKHLNAEREAYA